MRTTNRLASASTLLICMIGMTAGGCSDDKSDQRGNGGGRAGAAFQLEAGAGSGAKATGTGATSGASTTQTAAGAPTNAGSTGWGGSNLTFARAGSAGLAGVAGVAGMSSQAGTAGSVGNGIAGRAGYAGAAGVAGTPAGNAGTSGTGAPFARLTASVSSPILRVTAQQSVPVTVTITKEGSDAGAVVLSLKEKPFGLGAQPVTVASGVTSGILQIQTQTSLSVGGPYTLTIGVTSAADPSISTTIPLQLYVTQAPGSFDSSFGNSGWAKVKAYPQGTGTTVPFDHAMGAAVDSEGRVVIGGGSNMDQQRGWVIRLNTDGTLDDKFGTGGRLTTFGQPPTYVDDIAVAGDQIFLVARAQSSNETTFPYLRKVTAIGTSDNAFNGGLDVPLTGMSGSIAPYNGGVLVGAGTLSLIGKDGKVDAGFNAPTSLTGVRQFAPDPSGRVLVWDSSSGAANEFVITRLLPQGGLDSKFGSAGTVSLPCPADPLKSTGGTVAALTTTATTQISFIVTNCGANIRDSYNWEGAVVGLAAPDGQPILGMGPGGRMVLSAESPTVARGAIMQSDDRLVLLYGTMSQSSDLQVTTKYHLRRLTTVGKADTSLGTAGIVDLNASVQFTPSIIAYDATGQRVVLVGDDPSGGITVARLWL